MSKEARTDCPSNDFNHGKPSGQCWGDGHYLCQSCSHYRRDFNKKGQDYIDAVHNAQSGFGGILITKVEPSPKEGEKDEQPK